MKFDLKDFKKVNEDDKSITLAHKKGHKVSIAKNGISQNLKSQFASMKMADGGEVEDKGILDKITNIFSSEEPQQSSMIDPETQAKHNLYNEAASGIYGQDPEITKQVFAGSGNLFEGDVPPANFNPKAAEFASKTYDQEKAAAQAREKEAQAQSYDDALTENKARLSMGLSPNPLPPAPPMENPIQKASFNGVPQEDQPLAPAQPQGQLAQSDFDKYMKQYQQGYQQQVGGIEQQAKAESEQGAATQQAAHQQVQQVQELQKHSQDAFYELNQERLGLVNDVKGGKINPQHYVENMSVPGKVSTAIGILLSGVGSGLGGGENMAMKYLNDQIDRDIKSQQTNLTSKENLLSANLRQFGNMHDAMTMTRIMQNDIYSAKIQEEAAKAQGPLAQAKAQQMIGGLQQQNAQMMQNLSFQMGARRMLSGGGQQSQMDPAQKVALLERSGAIKEGEKEKVLKELDEAKNFMKARENTLKDFDEYAKLNTLGNTINPQARSLMKAIEGRSIPMLSKSTAGRFTESDANYIHDILKSKLDNRETVASKRKEIEKMFDDRGSFSTLDQYPGLGLNPIPKQTKIDVGPRTSKGR